MDLTLLTFFNQTMAHPLLDKLMVGLTLGGLGLLPGLALVLWLRGQQRAGLASLIALLASLVLVLVFQHLALRPRPDAVRLVWPAPNFPSYPSGHAAMAFSVAMILALTFRQWRWSLPALSGAGLIALSRVYLGYHYPSDLLGGAVLGAGVGAACYGLLVACAPNPAGWRWLLWPQVAVVIVVSQIAYLDILPIYLLRWPMADKVLHFGLVGAVAFWLNLWLNRSAVRWRQWSIPLAILLPFTFALAEEGIQAFSPLRTASLQDLSSDLAGLLFFWWLSDQIIKAKLPKPTASSRIAGRET